MTNDETTNYNPSIHKNIQDGYSPSFSMGTKVSGDTQYHHRAAQEYLITNLASAMLCKDQTIRLEFKETSGHLGGKYLSLTVWVKDN